MVAAGQLHGPFSQHGHGCHGGRKRGGRGRAGFRLRRARPGCLRPSPATARCMVTSPGWARSPRGGAAAAAAPPPEMTTTWVLLRAFLPCLDSSFAFCRASHSRPRGALASSPGASPRRGFSQRAALRAAPGTRRRRAAATTARRAARRASCAAGPSPTSTCAPCTGAAAWPAATAAAAAGTRAATLGGEGAG